VHEADDVTTSTAVASPPARAGLRQWLGLAALTLPVLLISMDNTVLSFAVPTLSEDLAPSTSQLLWIVDIYGFVLAGLPVTMGNLGDRIGRRRLLMAGATAFSIASVLAAFSPDATTLIAARALLGVAGATLMPSTLSLLRNIFTDDVQRRFAIAVWTTMWAVGSALGPIIGGWMLEHLWWGSVFLLGVPVTVGLLVVSPFLLPESRDPSPGRWDPLSAALSFATMLPVVYGIKMLAEHGPGPGSLGPMAFGLAAGVVFVRRQRRLEDPMIDVSLFASTRFRAAVAANLVALFAFAGSLFFITQYLQTVLGMTPVRAGLVLVPGVVASVVFTLSAGQLRRVLSLGQAIAAGMFVASVGFLVLATASASGGASTAVVAYMLVGAGVGVAMSLTVDAIMSDIPPAKAGAGSAISETANEFGIALGTAVLGTVVLAVYRRGLDGSDALGGVPAEALEAARETLGGAVHAAGAIDEASGAALLDAARLAFTDGMQVAALVAGTAVAAVAVLTAYALRQPRRRLPAAEPAEPAPAHA
jgi:DHA2 family multidrug resistance protein-like MFS transporter